MRIGVLTTSSEIPPATANPYNTATAFMIGRGDTGAVGSTIKCLSITDVTVGIGARSATNSALWDAADVFFREGGSVLYISRVVGPTPVNATLMLQDASAHPTIAVTAKYPGAFGNTLHVTVTVVSTNHTVIISDGSGNTLETFGPFANAGGNVNVLASVSSYVNFTQGSGSGFTTAAPAALSSTALATGSDNYGSVTLTQFTAALTAISRTLGPGQVSAPGVTNTTVSGIWAALGAHCIDKNRVAVCDMNDAETATTLISDLASFGTSSAASYCGFWAGSCVVPGDASQAAGATRTVAASAVISALCARADQAGNPNQAAAGDSFALKYVTGFLGTAGAPPFGQTDIDSLNAAGINTWNTVFGVPQNYGFVSSILSTSDSNYWQFNHGRTRMAITALFQVIGQAFVFSQIDGKGLDLRAFGGKLASSLQEGFVRPGALYTQAPDGSQDQGFVVDVGPSENTPTTIASGQLNGNVSVRYSPFAQLVQLNLNAVPVTQQL